MSEFISRSEMKRIYKQVGELAKEVADLSDKDLKSFPGGTVIHEEILATRGLSGGAKNRQVKYLAKVMRQGPLEEIYVYITKRKGSKLHAKKQSHTAERLRDTLINEAMELNQECLGLQIPFEPDWESPFVNEVITEYPSVKEKELRQVVYQYVKTHDKDQYRELFRMMKAAVDLKERSEKKT